MERKEKGVWKQADLCWNPHGDILGYFLSLHELGNTYENVG